MNKKTRMMLEEAQAYCDENDKSTEFMIQYMQGFAGVDHDTVMDFLISQSEDGENEYCIEFTAIEETIYQVTIKADSPEEAFEKFDDPEFDPGDYHDEAFLGTTGEKDVKIIGKWEDSTLQRFDAPVYMDAKKKFMIYWDEAHTDPKSEIHGIDFFTKNNGFNQDIVDNVYILDIYDQIILDDDHMLIVRVR